MKKLTNIYGRRGFTLVEVSVGLVVLLVLIMLSSSIILFSGNIFIRNAIINDNSIIAENVCSYIADKLTCAKSVEITSSQSVGGNISADYYEQLALTDGGTSFTLARPSITATVSDISTAEELNGRSIKLLLDYNSADGYITVTVRLMNGKTDGEQLCEVKRTVPLLNKNAAFFTEPVITATENMQYSNVYITYSYLD